MLKLKHHTLTSNFIVIHVAFIYIFSGEKTVKKQQMTIHEFQGFISNVSSNEVVVLCSLTVSRTYQNQRNPFLKDTVIRPITKDQAQAVVERHENKLIEGNTSVFTCT